VAEPETGYDLVHLRARPWEPGRARTPALVGVDFEFQGESLSLEAARSRRRALDRHGITVLIVPVRYRQPALTPAEALARARQALEQAGDPDHAPAASRLRLCAEHPMFLTFCAPVPGRAPGDPGWEVRVSVDRCDGHVWTDEEMEERFALMGPR
jgi:hypothetical protein